MQNVSPVLNERFLSNFNFLQSHQDRFPSLLAIRRQLQLALQRPVNLASVTQKIEQVLLTMTILKLCCCHQRDQTSLTHHD